MQIVIDIDKDQYEMVKQYRGSYDFGYAIAEGTVLPEGCQIITKEVYDYLCAKAEGTEGIGADLQQTFDEGYEQAEKVYQKAFEDIRTEFIRWIEMDGGSYEYDKALKRGLIIVDKHDPAKMKSEGKE